MGWQLLSKYYSELHQFQSSKTVSLTSLGVINYELCQIVYIYNILVRLRLIKANLSMVMYRDTRFKFPTKSLTGNNNVGMACFPRFYRQCIQFILT